MSDANTTTLQGSALQTMVDEMQKISPDITSTFIFKEHGEILAKGKCVNEQSAQKLIKSFHDIEDKAKTIGGLTNLTAFNDSNEVNINVVDDIYLATICPKEADKKTVELLTKVFVPSVVRIVDQLANNSQQKHQVTVEAPVVEPTKPVIDNKASEVLNPAVTVSQQDNLEGIVPEVNVAEPVSNPEPELPTKDYEVTTPLDLRIGPLERARLNSDREIAIVEKHVKVQSIPEVSLTVGRLGGLLARPDIVRIDKELIDRWSAEYPHIRIEKVNIDAPGKKTVSCKVEPIKDKKYMGMAFVLMPDTIQRSMGIAWNGSVVIKPVISEE